MNPKTAILASVVVIFAMLTTGCIGNPFFNEVEESDEFLSDWDIVHDLEWNEEKEGYENSDFFGFAVNNFTYLNDIFRLDATGQYMDNLTTGNIELYRGINLTGPSLGELVTEDSTGTILDEFKFIFRNLQNGSVEVEIKYYAYENGSRIGGLTNSEIIYIESIASMTSFIYSNRIVVNTMEMFEVEEVIFDSVLIALEHDVGLVLTNADMLYPQTTTT